MPIEHTAEAKARAASDDLGNNILSILLLLMLITKSHCYAKLQVYLLNFGPPNPHRLPHIRILLGSSCIWYIFRRTFKMDYNEYYNTYVDVLCV